jgi:two-component system NarL family sensor kinase
LHDSLGQNLLLIKNRIEQALKSQSTLEEAQEHLRAAAQLAAEAVAEVRHISHDLRPYQLDQIGLTRSLTAMIDNAAGSTGLVFTKRIEGVDEIFSSDEATHLYRVVQECINNILKHAAARRVEVELERDVRHVRLRIKDDGQGFASASSGVTGGSGMGLRNVAERVRILGGTLRWHSAPGEGMFLEVAIPIEDE